MSGRPSCSSCKGEFDPVEVLRRATGYSTDTNSGTASCPHCGGGLEFRVGTGELELGFTYWAGSMHFEGMETWPLAGLRCVRDGGMVSAQLRGEVFRLTAGGCAP